METTIIRVYRVCIGVYRLLWGLYRGNGKKMETTI